MVVETSRSIADVARELGLNETTLGYWVKAYRERHAGDEPELGISERARLRELERRRRPRAHSRRTLLAVIWVVLTYLIADVRTFGSAAGLGPATASAYALRQMRAVQVARQPGNARAFGTFRLVWPRTRR